MRNNDLNMSSGVDITRQRYQWMGFLRGIAALTVLYSHWVSWTLSSERTPNILDKVLLFIGTYFIYFGVPGGLHPGVSVFIVLSGFLIHLPVALQPEKVSQNGFWHTYFYRRIMRIAPVYWLACIMGLAAFTLVPVLSTPFVLQNIKLAPWNFGDLIAKLFFLDGLWPSSGTRLGNNILNVVSIEMWLYAAYPLTLFIRRNQGWRGVFILSGMFHGVAFGLWLIGVNPVYAGIGLLGHSWQKNMHELRQKYPLLPNGGLLFMLFADTLQPVSSCVLPDRRLFGQCYSR
jgi:peptidoglycan/LPS O-acetylase OafA/YrhL